MKLSLNRPYYGIRLGNWSALLVSCSDVTDEILEAYWTQYGHPTFTLSEIGPNAEIVFITVGEIPASLGERTADIPGLTDTDRDQFISVWDRYFRMYEEVNQDRKRKRNFSFSQPAIGSQDNLPGIIHSSFQSQIHGLVIQKPSANAHLHIHIFAVNLAAWWHIQRGGMMLHASAIARTPQDGFVFLGRSEAGKSTVANISAERGYGMLSDDLTLVAADSNPRQYQLAAVPSLRHLSHPYSSENPWLKGIFVLKQDQSDYLRPLSKAEIAATLFQGFQETPSHSRMPEPLRLQVIRTASQIARIVPGYELHFRKSPEFWKVIDAEFNRGE